MARNYKKVTTSPVNAIADLGKGIDALFKADDLPEFKVKLDEIEILEQVRTEFEDEDQGLLELAKSIQTYQIHPILLRIMPEGHPKPYRLVAGERRVRAAALVGMDTLKAKAKKLTDEEANFLQFEENIHRKNLTQIEMAARINADIGVFGSIEAILPKYNKSRSWVSKHLALLDLPEQTKRLVSENVSADMELIGRVKTIEKIDPEAASKLVEELKESKGKANARDKVKEAIDNAKPKKKAADKDPAQAKDEHADDAADSIATERDRTQEEPSAAIIWTRSVNQEDGNPLTLAASIFAAGKGAAGVISAMDADALQCLQKELQAFFDDGLKASCLLQSIVQGMRENTFALNGVGVMRLAAFLLGSEKMLSTDFSTVELLQSVDKIYN